LKGNLKEIKNSYPATKIEVSTIQDITNIIEEIGLDLTYSKNNEYVINMKDEKQGRDLFQMLAHKNIQVDKFELKKPSLHDIFIEKVGD